jgi:hypothetical protein
MKTCVTVFIEMPHLYIRNRLILDRHYAIAVLCRLLDEQLDEYMNTYTNTRACTHAHTRIRT